MIDLHKEFYTLLTPHRDLGVRRITLPPKNSSPKRSKRKSVEGDKGGHAEAPFHTGRFTRTRNTQFHAFTVRLSIQESFPLFIYPFHLIGDLYNKYRTF